MIIPAGKCPHVEAKERERETKSEKTSRKEP